MLQVNKILNRSYLRSEVYNGETKYFYLTILKKFFQFLQKTDVYLATKYFNS
ncbi:hypothetical protein ACVWYG_002896 [Pedobacter sp. UYEF25]